MEQIYKQIPRLSKSGRCVVCHKPVTDTITGKILIYYKSSYNSKIIDHKLPYCRNCDIMYGTHFLNQCIKIEYPGYHAALFCPKSNGKEDRILSQINKYINLEYKVNQAENTKDKEYTKKTDKINIGNKTFEVFPIMQCNMKTNVKFVYVTPIGFTRCPICGEKLFGNFVYAIEIENGKCIKTQGYSCDHCKAFFTVSKKLLSEIEKLRVNKQAYELKMIYCDNYDISKYKFIFENRESAYKQITVCSEDEIRTYTLVCKKRDINKLHNIIHYTSELSVDLLAAEIYNKPLLINDKKFFVVRVKNKKKIAEEYGVDRLLDNPYFFDKNPPDLSEREAIYIYNGKIKCHDNHFMTEVRVTVDDINNGESFFYAEYCYDCDQYLMKYNDYENYLKKYQFFPININMFGNGFGQFNHKEKSPLLLNGYNVNTTEDFSREERQKILMGIIENGVLSKRKVLDYLEMFIKEGINNPRRQMAILKWQEDKDFVLNYCKDDVKKAYLKVVKMRR